MMGTNNGLNNSLANCTGLPITGILSNGRAGVTTFLCGQGWATIGGSGRLLNVQYRAGTSGTYTCTAGTNSILVFVIGAGGGGGGVPATLINECAAGAGGGAGSCAIKYYSVVPTGTSFALGAGGAGGNAGSSYIGGTGATSTFNGGDITVLGASGGGTTGVCSTTTVTGYAAGGAGGSISGISADLIFPGSQGAPAFFTAGVGMSGGGGINGYICGLTAQEIALSSSGDGNTSLRGGTGGGGAANLNANVARSGGAGGTGALIIYEYS